MPYGVINQGGTPGTLTTAMPAKTGYKVRLIAMCVGINANGTFQLQSSGGRVLTGPIDLTKGFINNFDMTSVENSECWTESDAGEGINIVSNSGGLNGCCVYMYVPN